MERTDTDRFLRTKGEYYISSKDKTSNMDKDNGNGDSAEINRVKEDRNRKGMDKRTDLK